MEDYDEKLKLLGNLPSRELPSSVNKLDAVRTRLEDLRSKLLRQRIVYSVDWVVQDISHILETIDQEPLPAHPKPLEPVAGSN